MKHISTALNTESMVPIQIHRTDSEEKSEVI